MTTPESKLEKLEGALAVEGFGCRYQLLGARVNRSPVFFLSGAFQSMASWYKFARHFAGKTQVLLADLPGMGEADLLPRRYGLDFLAEGARKILDAAGIERACVISASYGSPVAYRLAQLHPERVERVVLAGVMKDIPSAVRGQTAHTLTTLASGKMREFAEEVVAGLLCRDPDKAIEKRRVAERLLLGQLERMSVPDRERYIENTARLLDHAPLDLSRPPPTPALVFTGEHDVYTRPEACREIANALPRAIYTEIERADHLFHIERFETTLELLDCFYEGKSLDHVPGCRPAERSTARAA